MQLFFLKTIDGITISASLARRKNGEMEDNLIEIYGCLISMQ